MTTSFSRNLRVGVMFVGSVSLLGLVIITLGGASSVFEDRYQLRAEFPDVAGLRPGANVRLAGIVVGEVAEISFPESSADKLIELNLSVQGEYSDRIRVDSVARLETEGMLGDKYVSISIGSVESSVLENNGQLDTEQSTSMLEYQRRATELLNNAEITTRRVANMLGSDEESEAASVARVLRSVESLMQAAERGDGLLNALLYDTRITNGVRSSVGSMSNSAAALASITTEVQEGDGLANELIYGGAGTEFANEITRLTDSVASLVENLESEESLLHSLMYDPEAAGIVTELQATVEGLRSVVEGIQSGQGTMGLLAQDPSLYEEVRSLFGGAQRNTLLRNYIRRTIEQAETEDASSWDGAE